VAESEAAYQAQVLKGAKTVQVVSRNLMYFSDENLHECSVILKQGVLGRTNLPTFPT
jgi:hypothetical protein